MPGPRVAGGRPDPGQTAGVFTQAFSTVMDAIQAGEQAKLLKLQIETGAKQQVAQRLTTFVDSMLKAEMARNPGGMGAAIEMYAPMLGKVAGLNGLDPTSSENMWRDVAAQVKANPSLAETISKDVSGWIAADAPEQTAVLQQYGAAKQAPPVEETPAVAPTDTPVIPPESPDEDPWVRQMQGPVTPEKSALVKERFDAATEALKSQDMGDPLSVKQTTTALRQSREAAGAGSKKTDKLRLDDPGIQAKYEKMFGPNWMQIISYAAMGDETLNRYLGVEAGKNLNITLNPKEQAEADLIRKKVEHWEKTGEPVETSEALALARIEAGLRRELSADAAERAKATAEEATQRAEMQQRYSTRRTLIAEIEKIRKSYMKGGVLDEKRFLQDQDYGDKLLQLAEIEAQLNPDSPPPQVIYKTLKTGWWLWKKETEVPAGIERSGPPVGGTNRTMPDRSPGRPVTGSVDDMVNKF